jgi:hypothetical protein
MIPSLYRAAAAAALLLLAPAAVAQKSIKKCQDAEGRWHYGDTAAEECERSKITVIDKRGLKLDEVAAPRSQEEIERETRENAEERTRAEEAERMREEQQDRDQRLLATYEGPAAIVRARDERLEHIDRTIGTNNELIARLREKRVAQAQARAQDQVEAVDRQIAAYEEANATAREQRAAVEARYNADLERYRELVSRDASGSAAAR